MAWQIFYKRSTTLLVLAVLWQSLITAQPLSRRTPVVEVVERVGPCVVNISTSRISGKPEYNGFYGPMPGSKKTRSLGSGLIIAPEGFIVTNRHVIRRASQVNVTLQNKKYYQAEVIASDSQNDLALLKIEPLKALPAISWGNSSDIMIGETAIALGNPFGLQNTVTTGVVSATNRTIALEGKIAFHDFIQTDAAINPGNSGGALLNVYGQVIGINTAIYSKGQGLGFAIPAKRVRKTIGRLLDYRKGKGLWLGLELEEKNREEMDWLVKVAYVAPDSPADKAGIKSGDEIMEFQGLPVRCLFDFKKKVYAGNVGDLFVVRLRSQGEFRKVYLKIAVLPLQFQYRLLWRKIGVLAAKEWEGVVIKSVRKNSSAMRIGIRQGDVIVSIGGRPVRNVEFLNTLAERLEKGQAISIVLVRNGKRFGGRLVAE